MSPKLIRFAARRRFRVSIGSTAERESRTIGPLLSLLSHLPAHFVPNRSADRALTVVRHQLGSMAVIPSRISRCLEAELNKTRS